jgi:hypothetical protein
MAIASATAILGRLASFPGDAILRLCRGRRLE